MVSTLEITSSSERTENASDSSTFSKSGSDVHDKIPHADVGPPQPKKRVKVYPERANRVRSKKPKVRTGCKTCKIRRVKCGEEFPNCSRCIKFGVKCDGYNQPEPRPKPKQQALLPKRHRSTIRIMPETALFQNEHEHQYFLFFRDDVALDLSGNIPDSLWNFVVLRASVEEPALRYLSVALSALRKSQTYERGFERSKHHSFAIAQYGRALKRIQNVVGTYRQEDAIRISLISSLLIFCFENTIGQYEQAVTHMKSALALMRRNLSHTNKPYMQSRAGPGVTDLEREVMDSFVRLDNTIMARPGGPTDEPKVSRLQMKYSNEFMLPDRLHNSVEAKQYLEHLQYRSMPFLAHMPDYLALGTAYEPYIPLDDFQELASQLDEFASRFAPVLARTKFVEVDQFAAAATVQLQFLVTRVSILRVAYGNDLIPADEFINQSAEIVDLCGKVVRDPKFRKTFVMSCGILPALFVVLVLCPKLELKVEAVRILKSIKGRIEVVWDASAIAIMGERMISAGSEHMMCHQGRLTVTTEQQ